MKLAILALAICATTASVNAAVTVSISTAPSGAQFFLSGGTTVLPDGNHIRIGTFSVAPTANMTFTALAAAFDEFTYTASGSTSAPGTGRTNKTNLTGAPTGSPDSSFVGTKIYVWVYGAQSPGAGAAPTGLLQQGVFSTSVTTATFKDQATAVALSTANLDQAFGSYVSEGGTAASTLGAVGSVSKLTLAAPIPEPSASILALLGIGLLSRRKR